MTISLGRLVQRLEREGVVAEGFALDQRCVAAEVRDVTTDSRLAGRGTVFCAVCGVEADGHLFVGHAAKEGAVAALVERVDPEVDLIQIPVVQGRLAAAYAAAEFFEDPWDQMTMVGITGTNGKTTSTAILRHLLSLAMPTGSVGTLGALGPDGQVVPGTEGLTTPGPIALGRWLRLLHGDGARAIVMEVSSHSLHQQRVAAARFDVALFTNLSRDHLDYHHTLEEYRAAKLLLAELVRPRGALVVNADDVAWEGVRASGRRRVRFGMLRQAEVTAANLIASRAGMEFTLRTPDGAVQAAIPLFGTYNVANALGAAAVLWALGWTPSDIGRGLRELPQVSGRLERVPTPEGAPTVLIDYAHTPDALARALAALRPLVSGRLVVVFGAGGDRDPGKRPEMGSAAAGGADFSIVTSDNPRHESPDRIAEQVESGMGDAPRLRIIDRREAIRTAVQDAGPDDLVLLAGKGHETYQIWGDERRRFDERVVVREIFSGEGAES